MGRGWTLSNADTTDGEDRSRWHAILDQLAAGRVGDVTPEALEWFCDQAYRKDQSLQRLRARLADALSEDGALTPQPANAAAGAGAVSPQPH